MKKVLHLSLLILTTFWLSILPIGSFNQGQLKVFAQEEINPERISGLTPASGSLVKTSTPTVSAAFSYQVGATYYSATIYLNGNDDSVNAKPSAAGFSYQPDVGEGRHTVKVILVDTLGAVAIRNWSFTGDINPPLTNVKALPDLTQDHNIMVPVEGRDAVTGISQTELWYKFNQEEWRQGPIVVGLPSSIYFDAANRQGEGRYAFATKAIDNAGHQEIKELTEESVITFDATPPSQIARDKIIINQKAPGQADSIEGLKDAIDIQAVSVKVYADTALTSLIVQIPINQERGFGGNGIGDNQYASVYVVAVDAAGNTSMATKVDNDFDVSSAPKKLIVDRLNSTTVRLSWPAAFGADAYRLSFRKAGTDLFSDFIQVEENITTTQISGLESGVNYEFAVASKDLYGNESGKTIVKSLPTGTVPVAIGGSTVETPQVSPEGQTPTPSATPSPSPTPTQGEVTTPQAPPATTPENTTGEEPANTTNEGATTNEGTENAEENGEVQSEQAEREEGRNWTPWIVLAILIILAGAATGGYFYWFGGPEEITTTIKTTEEKKEEKEEKDKDNEARW